ncbi:C2 domain-containing protein [Gongronella butleri]|nr:C2 domain-containing protein [Gongronella butleri]
MLSSHKSPAGVLTVTVVSAKNLHKEDLGTNDAFVQLWFDEKYKQKTSVVKSKTPEWNETFTFNFEEGSRDHKLCLKVLDEDPLSNDKIGDTKIDISPTFNGQVIDEWVKLPHGLGLFSHGEVHIIARFQPN